MEDLKKLWDNSNPNQRLLIVNNQLNTWLPIQYHDCEFIEQMFDELPEPVRLWLVKYYLKKNNEEVNDLFDHSDMVRFASYCTGKDTLEIDDKFYKWLNKR